MTVHEPHPHAVARPLLWASRALNEAVMGFLALVALATAISPMVFEMSPATEQWLDTVDRAILALFIAEFIVQFSVARDRWAWVRSPWRIVDVVCIAGPLLSLRPHVLDALSPQLAEALSGTLAFRLLRVGRAVAFGARAGALAVQKRGEPGPMVRSGEAQVTVVTPGTQLSSRESSWTELLAWARDPHAAWYHASNVDREHVAKLGPLAAIPDQDIEHFLDPKRQPRLRSADGLTSLSLWLPTVEDGFPSVSRNRVLALVYESGLLTATWYAVDLPSMIAGNTAAFTALPNVTFPVRVTYGLLALARDRYAFVVNRHEEAFRTLEDVRANEGGAAFLNHAFRLQRETSAASSDVIRLKRIVGALAVGKMALPGVDNENEPFLDNLLVEIDSLSEQFDDLKESEKSLMELHMNVTSFEINKFMKLLAIVGFLGLIPSVAGGLLGMNVEGNPWSVTLGQVAFGIAMAMAISLYVFAIKGWLR